MEECEGNRWSPNFGVPTSDVTAPRLRPPAFSLSLSFSPFRSPAHLSAKPNTLDEAERFTDKVGLSSRRELCEVDGSAIASSLNTPYHRWSSSSSFFFLAHGTQLRY